MATLATVRVFEPGLTALLDKQAKLNKRAKRFGMNALDVRVVRTDAFIPLYRGGFGHQQDLHVVTINGAAPRIDGWALVARIEFNATIGPVVRIVPGREDDGSFAAYRTIGPVCEHCNSRRNRKDVFVLEHSDGRRKIVGRNCLADFLRCDDADAFANFAELADLAAQWEGEVSDGYFDGGSAGSGAVRNMRLDQYLPVVAMIMRRIGWMSRTAARDEGNCNSTADLAYRLLFAKDRHTRSWVEDEGLYADEGDNETAGRAIEWACEVCDDGNEYLNTIKRIAIAGQVDFKGLDGYAASIIIAYRKACEREADRAERAKNAKNKVWIGEVKKRERAVRVTCKGTHTFEGRFGPTTIVRFEHYVSEGEVAVLAWFASGSKERDWEEGTDYTVDFTCKGHDDDERYGKQTKINRVKACA